MRRILSSMVIASALIVASCGGSSSTADSPSRANGSTAVAPSTEAAALSDGDATAATETSPTTDGAEQQFPDVIDAAATRSGDAWTFDATISSPYDTPDRYADAWRVSGPDGTVYGIRELTHDHASEQPFTRSLSDIVVPDDVTTVTFEGRDQANGWGGKTFELTLP